MKKLIVLVLVCIVGIGTFLLGKYTSDEHLSLPALPNALASSWSDTYPFLSRRINVVKTEDRLIHLVPLRTELQKYISDHKETIGLYFEYIPTGVSLNINGNIPFTFASLLKTPAVMAVYKKENSGKISRDDSIQITDELIDTNYGTLGLLTKGTNISVNEAIKQALINSDNTAYRALLTKVDVNDVTEVFDSIDIPLTVENDTEPVVTPKNYISIFRSLYFSSYLPLEDSEEILDILSQSGYKNGIRKPIPEDIKIAHKMGIKKDTNTLSDCGIVYLPQRPYFLCVMVRSEGETDKSPIIQEISEKIYTYISSK